MGEVRRGEKQVEKGGFQWPSCNAPDLKGFWKRVMADPQGKEKHKFAKTQILRSSILPGFPWLVVVSGWGKGGDLGKMCY
jgi:hypothetical protein